MHTINYRHTIRHFWLPVVILALLSVGVTSALADGNNPQQVVDGYRVTLVTPENGWLTGVNPVVVILQNSSGNTVMAEVSLLQLAYKPEGDAHGATHSDVADDDHGNADDNHGNADDDHGNADDDHGDDGQGVVAAPVRLRPNESADAYIGDIHFDQPGTWTIGVVFSINGVEHGAIFDAEVAQSRPRGLVLGGFALLNALAIGAAAWIKRYTPLKPARKTN